MFISLGKTGLLTEAKNAVDHLKEGGEILLYALSKTISKNLKYLLMAMIILGSFLKPVRTLPDMEFVDKYHYNLMFLGFGLLPFLWSKGKMLTLDALVYASLFFTSTSFIIAGYQTDFGAQISFAAQFIFPASTYFIFRHISFSEKAFINCLKIFIVISVAFVTLEFLVANYFIHFPPFAFAEFAKNERDVQFEVDKFAFMIPFLGNFIRAWGQTGRPQATGSLFAALSVFFFALHYYQKRARSTGPWLKFFVFFPMVGLLLTGSKTGIVLLLWMFLFIVFGFNIITFLAIPAIGFLGVTPFFLEWADVSDSLSVYAPALFSLFDSLAQTDYQYWIYTLFGQGEEVIEFSTQTALIESFLQTGFFNYLIFLFILITYLRYGFILGKRYGDRFVFAGLLFTLTITMGSLHYETLFIYPCNVLVLALMGFTAKRMDDSLKQWEKEVLNVQRS